MWSIITPISSMVTSSEPLLIKRRTFLAPVILLSFNNGESSAFFTASSALFSPEAMPFDIKAVPEFCKTDFASRKSMFTSKYPVITSAIPFAAFVSTSSALENPDLKPRFPYCWRSLSLLITIRESTLFLSFSKPKSACSSLLFPSKLKGTVTIPTVRIPMSFATFAITGAAPVPVPPPIPAVMKTIFVFCPIEALISSILSIAAFSPTSGSAPAPKPSVMVTPS